MNTTCEQIADELQNLVEGRLDTLAPEHMSAIEAHLNECPTCAARLARAQARPQADLRDRLAAPAPARAPWDAVWERIETHSAAEPVPPRRRLPVTLRIWSGLSAAAAVILLATIWWLTPPATDSPWDLRLAGPEDVQIQALEVFGDTTSIVLTAEGDDAAPIIWVIEENERQS
jgi:anti-sigma factor RsiW